MEIVKIGGSAISVVNQNAGTKENGITIFECTVLDLLEFFGLEWSVNQIRGASEILFDEYYYWTLAELKHFSLKTKKGDFGKVYGKFSPSTLMECASAYDSEILTARASYLPVVKEADPVEYVPQEKVSEALNSFVSQWEAELAKSEKKEDNTASDKQKAMVVRYCQDNGLDYEVVKKDWNVLRRHIDKQIEDTKKMQHESL